MNFFRSIKFRVWTRFVIIVLAMLAITYICLIAMFPMFYGWMKSYEINEAFVEIRSNWESDNFGDILDKQASAKKMYIEIIYPNNSTIIVNRLDKIVKL